MLSTRPYLIRAIYEWCVDAGFTPHILVQVDEHTRVPAGYVKDGQIVLNIGGNAVRDLAIDNDWILFSARFSGASQEIAVPVNRVAAIFARENGQGMHFEVTEAGEGQAGSQATESPEEQPPEPPKGRPRLKVVK
ncbi:MAG: ClpXP protease specificity-enhancing factor [Pseudomonadota bacterium]